MSNRGARRHLDGQSYPNKRRYSLAFLKHQGALEPTVSGCVRFVWYASRTGLRGNPWAALRKDKQWSSSQLARVKKAQTYLRSYGRGLAELGMLEP